MPDTVESDVEKLLKGLSLESEEAEICDFTLEEQKAALESEGKAGNIDTSLQPILGETVTYIVAGVFINEDGEVLMMQEAKQSCAGKWYLPAGRMEKGETIIEAMSREVLEETGLNVKPTTLLMVEFAKRSWFRFVLTGVVIGGTLKTPAQADKESLQAKWILNLEELTLRASDILHLIDRAKSYHLAKKQRDKTWHSDILPGLRSHTKLLLRTVIVIKKRSTNKVHVLMSERNSWHIPVCEINPGKSFHSVLRNFMIELFGADVPQHRPHGILSVEHNSNNNCDGLCLTILIAFKPPLEEVPIIGKCIWHETSKELGQQLLIRVASRNSTFPIHVIC
ncbi:8-oxo-dGDP phosphatase NUDT18 [Onthophagus taurus]|uniref:8-oxo-dGDP phosphatase NUDT18 n=1 Tax=Onthophagus taurus TaxID=166361 RepID=UPI000C209341|nr:8-oxo-dGDP phosphatase NUDT18 [Onthophagus taurus]